MSGDGGSFSHVSCHVGRRLAGAVQHLRRHDADPAVDAGTATVTVTTKGRDAGKAAVEFARALAREAQKFADEMERMHAAQLARGDAPARPLAAMRPEHAIGGAAGVRTSGRPRFSPAWN